MHRTRGSLQTIWSAYILVIIPTQRLPRPTLIFWLFVEALVDIMIFFAISVTFDLAQVLITLLLAFLDCSCVTTSGGGVGKPTLLILTVWTGIFLGLTQSLFWLASIPTIILVSGWRVVGFSSLRILVLVLVALYWSVSMGTVRVSFARQEASLARCFSLDIASPLNDFLTII